MAEDNRHGQQHRALKSMKNSPTFSVIFLPAKRELHKHPLEKKIRSALLLYAIFVCVVGALHVHMQARTAESGTMENETCHRCTNAAVGLSGMPLASPCTHNHGRKSPVEPCSQGVVNIRLPAYSGDGCVLYGYRYS